MPEYLAPGVYVEEIATGPVPIEGVSTSNVGFVGYTERGPSEPRLVTGWVEFQRWYGGLVDPSTLNSYLPYAVRGFFDNGGRRAFVTRIERQGGSRSAVPLAGATIEALGFGDLANRLHVRVEPASRRIPDAANPANPPVPDPARFKLTVVLFSTPSGQFVNPFDPTLAADPNRLEPEMVEIYDDLEWQPGTSDSPENRLLSSQLIRTSGPMTQRPPNGWTPLTGGGDGDAAQGNDYIGIAPGPGTSGTGLDGLKAIDEISILTVPDQGHGGLGAAVRNTIQQQVVLQCEELRDRFAILQYVREPALPASIEPPVVSQYAAVYHPWVRVVNPATGITHLVPPGGHVAGVYARTDIERGVHKAPANAVIRGIVNTDLPGNQFPLSVTITRGQQDILNPKGINIIRDFRADRRGIRVWGARTLSDNSQWRYVNVRRLFIFAEESIDEGTQWVVFEPNDEPTWARVRRSIGNFLDSVWRSGALMGTTQEEAFFVKCDRTTMTQDDIDNGRLICYIGLAPVKPAEFVIFRFSQKTVEATS